MEVRSTGVGGRFMGSNPSSATLLLCDHTKVTQPLWLHFLICRKEIINSPSLDGYGGSTRETLKTVPGQKLFSLM